MSEREIDAEVAEDVFGKQVTWIADDEPHAWSGVGSEPGFQESTKVPAYSTDISAAWMIIADIEWWGWELNGAGDMGVVVCYLNPGGTPYRAEADTAPLAICRAALKAVRSE